LAIVLLSQIPIYSYVGCVLPDHSEVEVELRDGESVSVDWHFEVYETILDTTIMCKVKKHSSISDSSNSAEVCAFNELFRNVCDVCIHCGENFLRLILHQ